MQVIGSHMWLTANRFKMHDQDLLREKQQFSLGRVLLFLYQIVWYQRTLSKSKEIHVAH